jgi:DnaJ-class molecular chaperone
MPWIICRKCEGTGTDPDNEEEECPRCKDSGNKGHIWRESFM